MLLTAPFNSFMAKKKPRASTADELAIIKAAAWAWYQHGSGSEGKPMGEFDITRTQQVPRPSRYKLEALRIKEEDNNTQGSSQTSSPIRTDNNSLLDSYEIESISKQLDQLIDSSGKRFYSKFFDDRRQKFSANRENAIGSTKKKYNKLRGFWHPVLCGTREDAVAERRLFKANRLPEKRTTAVKMANRPRVTHA